MDLRLWDYDMGYRDGDVIVYISHSSSYFLIIVFFLVISYFLISFSLSSPLVWREIWTIRISLGLRVLEIVLMCVFSFLSFPLNPPFASLLQFYSFSFFYSCPPFLH